MDFWSLGNFIRAKLCACFFSSSHLLAFQGSHNVVGYQTSVCVYSCGLSVQSSSGIHLGFGVPIRLHPDRVYYVPLWLSKLVLCS